jgi:hypothetical protein
MRPNYSSQIHVINNPNVFIILFGQISLKAMKPRKRLTHLLVHRERGFLDFQKEEKK